MKISILLKIIFFTILWHIILVFIEICNFVIPGKCSNCWMKWKFFRKTIIQENDEPRPICRSCIKKFKDTNLWDDLHGPQKYDPQYSNEVENESYVRVDLHDKEDVIDNFQVFPVDVEKDELQQSRTKDSEYWRVSVCMTYKSVNEDGMQNREYISGCIAFKQRDGQASAPHFWYEGCKHQSGMLWELVAKHLNVPPQDMSPRQFVAFLKSKPRVKITGVEYDNFGARKGDPAKVKKNMVGEFL
jgi:hypothetical protein